MMQQDQSHLAERLLERVRAARRLFLAQDGTRTSDGAAILDDLEMFCHANATTHVFDEQGRSDPLAAAQLEGRRQVWMRLISYVEIGDDELASIADLWRDE
mgnify:CR=1 FL=1